MKSSLLVLLLLLGVIFPVKAKVVLPAIIGDNMVLQQNVTTSLWGTSLPNKHIKVITSWSEIIHEVNADSKGRWNVDISTHGAGGPYEISFIDGDTLQIQNIFIGEVWLCSGQSNMEMPMKGFNAQPVHNSINIISDATSEVPIRMFTVEKDYSKKLENNVSGTWTMHDSEKVANFSATAYFFGKQLYETLKVPIGLINSSWGGSNIESWMPYDILKMYSTISFNHFNEEKIKVPQHSATLLYNAMLYPLHKVSISGMIWYQGEANCLRNRQYEELFPKFVKEVRRLFSNDSLPFYYVQVAPFSYFYNKKPLCGALLRESQMKCENVIPNSKMAVLTDLGEEYCIHPSQKETVGKRLAYLALSNTYQLKGIYAESPRYKSKVIDKNKVILNFEKAELGLTSFGKDLMNFEISGNDKIFYPAKAKIKGNQVIVWSAKVPNPIAVRYAFKNYVKGDLYSTSGIPVSSFRTDF